MNKSTDGLSSMHCNASNAYFRNLNLGYMKVAVVGATGLVGNMMLKVLEERNFPVTELLPVASENSVGKMVHFKGNDYPVISIEQAIKLQPQMALFSAGSSVSLQYAEAFAQQGCYVIDNSSAWRMEEGIPLVVPEVNGNILTEANHVIANPNCSTIQMVMVLQPLHAAYGIKRVVVSTYQSVTGTGVKAVQQLENERNGVFGERAYAYQIDKNAIPQIDVFLDNGYTKEEMKMANETKKIMGDDQLLVSATCVRIPTTGGHSESVNIALKNAFELKDVKDLLSNTAGVVVLDNPIKQEYPMPLFADGNDDVFVGRIRRDETIENGLNLWIVADNLRKGAATNAVQIAEKLIEKGFVRG